MSCLKVIVILRNLHDYHGFLKQEFAGFCLHIKNRQMGDCWLAEKKNGEQLPGCLLDWKLKLKLNNDNIDNISTGIICLIDKIKYSQQEVYSKTAATKRRKIGKIGKKNVSIRQKASSSSQVMLFQRDSKYVLSVWKDAIQVCSLSRPNRPKERNPQSQHTKIRYTYMHGSRVQFSNLICTADFSLLTSTCFRCFSSCVHGRWDIFSSHLLQASTYGNATIKSKPSIIHKIFETSSSFHVK